MTGEVTLQGRVLPVGGIREKCLAALNLGITNVIIPMANAKDLEDIPNQFKEKMSFILVDNLDEVFAVAFEKSEAFMKNLSSKKGDKKTKPPTAAA
jgi:ATP-dependent Lon protease